MLPGRAPADGAHVEGHHLLVVFEVVQVDAGRLSGLRGGRPRCPRPRRRRSGRRCLLLLLVLGRARAGLPPPPPPLLRLLRRVLLLEAVFLVTLLI